MTLLKRLQDTRAWMTETKGRSYVMAKLTQDDMDRIIGALHSLEITDGEEKKSLRKPLTNCA